MIIRNAEEMPREALPWKEMDPDWAKRLEAMGKWWYQKNPVSEDPWTQKEMDKAVLLRNKLLTFGGNIACMGLSDMHYDAIMERGQYWYGGDCVSVWDEIPKSCHYNSCVIWKMDKNRLRIATGYALSEDGCWRKHSWIVEPLSMTLRVHKLQRDEHAICAMIEPREMTYSVCETTTQRIAYFGAILTPEECETFCEVMGLRKKNRR